MRHLLVALVAVSVAGASTLSPAVLLAQTRAVGSRTHVEILPGSTAEYRVREQLARLNFPNDAIGTTDSLAGTILIGPDGSLGGRLTVDLRDLESDSGRRDGFLRENTLHTSRFPVADFVPRRQQGLPVTLPSSGKTSFTLTGDMTVHGVTSSITWNVIADLGPGTLSAQATTRFPFKTFGLTIPKVMGLLSVDDDIRLVLNVKASRHLVQP